MTRRWMRACMSAVVAGALGLGGACSRSQTATADTALASDQVQQLLRHIPADTPYAFVGLGGSMRPFVDRVFKSAEPLLKDADAQLARLAQDAADHPDGKLVAAIIDELRGKLSPAGFEELGFTLDGRYALYGLGLLPALRVQLRDGAALRATLERIQAKSGVTWPTKTHGGQTYWSVGDGKAEAALAIVGDELVAAMVAGPTRERALSLLFGQEQPAASLAGSPVLKDMMTAHGLTELSVGFVDLRVLTDVLVGGGEGLNRDTAAAVYTAAQTPECAAEIRGLAGLVPRIVFGSTRLDASGLETKVVAELRPDLFAGLDAVRTAVPGIAGALAPEAMMAFASGVDVQRALELAKAQAALVTASPFRCPALADLNRAARDIAAGVDSVPKTVRDLRGGALVLEDASFAGFMPTEVKGFVTLGTADPQGLMRLAAAGAPQLGLPELPADGTPQRLQLGGLPLPIPFEMYLAGRPDRGLALAVGPGAETRAGALLSEPSEAKPLMLFTMNYGRLLRMLPTGADVAGAEIVKMLGSQGSVIDVGEGGLTARSWVKFTD